MGETMGATVPMGAIGGDGGDVAMGAMGPLLRREEGCALSLGRRKEYSTSGGQNPHPIAPPSPMGALGVIGVMGVMGATGGHGGHGGHWE